MTTNYLELATPGIRELQPYQTGKPIEELQRELGISSIIKLASNENPLGPSPQIAAAISAALPDLARYPDGSAYRLRHKLAKFLAVEPNNLTMGNGSNDVLELLARVYLRPGLEAICSQHSFVVYPLATKVTGASLKVIPAKNFNQDLDATLSAVGPNTRMIFIANPNNPTGTWIDESTLTRFLDQLRDDIIVVLDEAYFEYVDAPTYPDGIELFRRYPNVVVTRTFSKAYGLAALRMGYAVSHPDIADLMNRVRQPFNVNSLSLVAAEVALDDQAHVKQAVALNREGMQTLTVACEGMGLGYIPSVGNFISIDFGRDTAPIYEALLREGVIVRPIGGYQMPNHLRVTIGVAEENARFLEALQKVLG
ncbi:MAG: histidinol-phosphate aminotransferase [Candidatus Azotimanducaceae bacterium]|jgi:histidinol-phosphate aminotransferase